MARKEKQESTAPKKQGRLAQIRQVYTAAHQVDRLIGWWMLLAFVGTLVVAVGIGVLVGHWPYALILGLPLALLAATLVMSRRAERAAYSAIEGQPGAAGAALGALRKGWFYEQQPVALEGARGTRPEDMVNAAFVFRAVGRPGIVLIGEGPQARVSKLLVAERKKVERVAPGVPVTLLQAGDADGQVPLRKLSSKITRLKPVLTKDEVSVVNKRLKSLGGIRPPVPAGMDPMRARVDRKAMRGR
jgi:F0F1-type ATP synthase assembly protein I